MCPLRRVAGRVRRTVRQVLVLVVVVGRLGGGGLQVLQILLAMLALVLQRLAAVGAVLCCGGRGSPAHGQRPSLRLLRMGESVGVGVGETAARVAAVERGLILVGIHGGRLQGTFVVVGVRAAVVYVVRVAVRVVGLLLGELNLGGFCGPGRTARQPDSDG